jgi:hypothetical protein
MNMEYLKQLILLMNLIILLKNYKILIKYRNLIHSYIVESKHYYNSQNNY